MALWIPHIYGKALGGEVMNITAEMVSFFISIVGAFLGGLVAISNWQRASREDKEKEDAWNSKS